MSPGLASPVCSLLAEVRLEDVFRSTQESMNSSPGSDRLIVTLLGSVAIIVLLLVLHQYRKQQANPKKLNHPGKLLREVGRSISVKPAEMRQLRHIAEQQSCSSPLVLLLCPSILAKGLKETAPERKKVLAGVLRKMD
jgi:hypothetical protein